MNGIKKTEVLLRHIVKIRQICLGHLKNYVILNLPIFLIFNTIFETNLMKIICFWIFLLTIYSGVKIYQILSNFVTLFWNKKKIVKFVNIFQIKFIWHQNSEIDINERSFSKLTYFQLLNYLDVYVLQEKY